MMKSIHLVITILLGAGLIGCGIQRGFIRDAASAQVFKYELKPKAISYVRSVQGESVTNSLFCIIPLDDTPLYAEAMKQLYLAASLGKNQSLANLREDRHLTTYLGFYCIWKLVISGDVIEAEYGEKTALTTRTGPGVDAEETRQPSGTEGEGPGAGEGGSGAAVGEKPGLEESVPDISKNAKEPHSRYEKLLARAKRADMSGKLDTAIGYAQQAVKADPKGSEVHKMLGTFYQAKRFNQLARKHFETYLKLRPDASDKATIQRILNMLK